MANMTFKASLLPNTDLGYSLGSSTQRWKLNGSDPDDTYVLKAGDTMTGHLSFTEKSTIFKIDRKKDGGGGWAYTGEIYKGQDENTFANIGVFGSANTLTYMYIGAENYDNANNLRIYPNGAITAQKLILLSNQDASGTADNKPALIIGNNSTSAHIEIDNNEILSKTNGTTSGTLYLQDSTGTTQVSGTGGLKVFDITIAGDATTDMNKRTIKSSSTLYFDRGADTSLLFLCGGSAKIRIDGSNNFRPETTNTCSLGSSSYRWATCYIGTANSYGGATQPIYWDNGVPKAANAYSTLLTAFSTSTNTISITVGGTTKTTSAVTGVSNTWTAGTTAGPKIKTTVNGVAGDAVAIPSASESASGVITTGAQAFKGRKTFGYTTFQCKNDSGSAVRYADFFIVNAAGTAVGEYWYDCGNATNISSGRWGFREYSPNSTANTSTTGFYETYYYPTVTAGLTENKTYYLLTTKDYSTLDGRYVNISGDTMTGNLTVSKSGPAIYAQDTANNNLQAGLIVGSGHQNHGVYSNGYAPTASTFTSSGKWIIYRGSDGEAHSNLKIYGAVWNDYAEYRKDNPIEKDRQKPGRCVRELGDGTLALTTERLMRGCEIISDTFGFAIGQNKDKGYDTPIASSGRVLAYPYENIEEFKKHIGYCVCSGPNGTVSIMTDEEEEKYPGRIIGTISEVPDYEEWECGTDGKEKIKVNGRVWIRIR